ncbi:diguanylate cyclase [Vibrio sp. MACH09]|uniref:diguanylate cyclase n=1 Tax=Vibrio sp. MACH09 TaxID=3025122 RepID=UPI00278E5E61|nr:diguanylate cyclase [Vibrio sp. MACH09]GLO61656.1 diguanylate cyclase [Vibrio sp. MACH09]
MNNRVLIVEDSKVYRSYLESQFSKIDIQVVLCESFQQAKEIIDKDVNFLCAVLDYCLPDAQHGEVIDYALTKKLKVVVLTANFDEQTRDSVLEKGVIDYILKENMASVSYLLPLISRLNNNKHHKALIVDDSNVVRQHLATLLEHQYITTLQAENGQQAIELLQQHRDITLIIADHNMPVKDGITMTREIRRQYDRSQLAILGISSSESHNITARFIKAGANDFLHKPFNQEELFCRINNMLEMRDISDELYKMANQDALTGLWNRRYLFQHASTSKDNCNVAMLDIDYFKKINDHYGHEGGDQALVTLSHIISIYFSEDLVARFGGEEFCIINYGDYEQFVQRLERLRTRVEKTPIDYLNKQINLTISIGATRAIRNLDTMIRHADDRLYLAKENGRNQVIYNDDCLV